MTTEDEIKDFKTSSVTSPFENLQIADTIPLSHIGIRTPCLTCNKSVKYFCYFCFRAVPAVAALIPTVALPLPVDVIKHEEERDGKSTAVYAKVVAPDRVEIHPSSRVPEFEDLEGTVLLYPSPDAKSIHELPKGAVRRLVVVDGTWVQAKQIVRTTESLRQMQKVTIAPRRTTFWRYQDRSENYLSTIEAIYYFFCEHWDLYGDGSNTPYSESLPYDGRYDNLLFFYKFFYEMIQQFYREKSDRRFTTRHREDYIHYDS